MTMTISDVMAELIAIIDIAKSTCNMSVDDLDACWEKLNQLQGSNQIEIYELDYKGTPDAMNESITLRNRGALCVDISGWRLQAGSSDLEYIFPEHTLLPAYEELRINTSGPSDHSFNINKPIWNNRGDRVILLDKQGKVISGWVYGSKAHQAILISHIHANGNEYRDEGDEFVELCNISANTVDLSGWHLDSARGKQRYVFTDGTKVGPYQELRVYTNKSPLGKNEYSFESKDAIWNNKSSCATLHDSLSREVSQYFYERPIENIK